MPPYCPSKVSFLKRLAVRGLPTTISAPIARKATERSSFRRAKVSIMDAAGELRRMINLIVIVISAINFAQLNDKERLIVIPLRFVTEQILFTIFICHFTHKKIGMLLLGFSYIRTCPPSLQFAVF